MAANYSHRIWKKQLTQTSKFNYIMLTRRAPKNAGISKYILFVRYLPMCASICVCVCESNWVRKCHQYWNMCNQRECILPPCCGRFITKEFIRLNIIVGRWFFYDIYHVYMIKMNPWSVCFCSVIADILKTKRNSRKEQKQTRKKWKAENGHRHMNWTKMESTTCSTS